LNLCSRNPPVEQLLLIGAFQINKMFLPNSIKTFKFFCKNFRYFRAGFKRTFINTSTDISLAIRPDRAIFCTHAFQCF
jgi:hypothetical protein